MSHSLPSFERPPLIETVLGVQFAPIKGLSTAHLGLFWGQLGESWTRAGEAEALGQLLIEEELPSIRLDELVVHGQSRRLRFLDESKTRLLQVENGWLVYNWRRHSDADAYPRFHQILPEFLALLAKWKSFLAARGLGEMKANLWEVCYVNAIERDSVWEAPADWAEFLPTLLSTPRLTHLGPPTTGAIRWRFPLPRAVGSLEITLDHVLDPTGEREALRITQVARGRLTDLQDLEARLRAGHETIVQTFEAMTSDTAQRHWGRNG